MSALLWYLDGTVSVTASSDTVTGSGTAWVANAKIGYAIFLPDGKPYRIDAIASDTSLTISPDYGGGNATGQSYIIVPTSGITAEFNESALALLSTVQGYVAGALAGRFGAGTVGAPGVSFTGDTDTGLYNAAANQIALATGGTQRALLSNTALNLSVPITGSAAVQQSATDTTAGRLMRADYGYSPGNVLGTVSQSGGTVTGALIERGSNANGEYARFADGTQICWFGGANFSFTASATSNFDWTYPAAFSGGPGYVACTPSFVAADWSSAADRTKVSAIGPSIAPGASSARLTMYMTGSITSTVANCDAIAVGHWF